MSVEGMKPTFSEVFGKLASRFIRAMQRILSAKFSFAINPEHLIKYQFPQSKSFSFIHG